MDPQRDVWMTRITRALAELRNLDRERLAGVTNESASLPETHQQTPARAQSVTSR